MKVRTVHQRNKGYLLWCPTWPCFSHWCPNAYIFLVFAPLRSPSSASARNGCSRRVKVVDRSKGPSLSCGTHLSGTGGRKVTSMLLTVPYLRAFNGAPPGRQKLRRRAPPLLRCPTYAAGLSLPLFCRLRSRPGRSSVPPARSDEPNQWPTLPGDRHYCGSVRKRLEKLHFYAPLHPSTPELFVISFCLPHSFDLSMVCGGSSTAGRGGSNRRCHVVRPRTQGYT